MQLTFLKIIQRILSATDSQSVTTASGSPESEQAGIIINRVYDEVLGRRDWPFLRKAGYSLVSNTPSVAWELELPSDCRRVEWIRYNQKNIKYLTPSDFIYNIEGRDTTASYVNSSYIYTDRDPSYWTSVDGLSIVFDGYDSDNATLLPAECYLQYIHNPTSELSGDSDVPALPTVFHNVLLDGALSLAFYELAQDTQKGRIYEDKYKRGLARMQVWAKKFDEESPNYRDKFDFGRTVI